MTVIAVPEQTGPEETVPEQTVPENDSAPSGRTGWVARIARNLPAGIARGPQSAGLVHCLGALALVWGLWGAWLQPTLSPGRRAFDLAIALPGGRHQFLSWGLLLVIGLVLAIAGITTWGRRSLLLTDLAALSAVTATVGFFVQSWIFDPNLLARLRFDQISLTDLQLVVGYKIPRPALTTIGPVPLPDSAALVASALRGGFYVALVGAVLLTLSAISRRRFHGAGSPGVRRAAPTRVMIVPVLIVCGLLVAGVVQGWLAQVALGHAAAATAAGDDRPAVTSFDSAASHDGVVGADPDVFARYGLSLLRTGRTGGPAAQLATSRLQLQAGKDLLALQTLAAAARQWPDGTTLREEFTMQAFAYLRTHHTPEPVRGLVSDGVDSALLRITLARYEIGTGDNPAAIADARLASTMTGDSDVLSAATTFQSLAQTRSGDAIGGRRTLLDAVQLDHDYVNVMARSMLTGLYSTLPL